VPRLQGNVKIASNRRVFINNALVLGLGSVRFSVQIVKYLQGTSLTCMTTTIIRQHSYRSIAGDFQIPGLQTIKFRTTIHVGPKMSAEVIKAN